MIRAIAAIDDKRGIASGGGIPWNIPEDSRYFRAQTENGVVLMGRDTYDEFAEPLPNRRNVVVSRTLTDVRPGFELCSDVAGFLQAATGDIWIIGGAGLYASTLRYCNELLLTHIDGNFKCDRFFPAYAAEFKLARQTDRLTDGEYNYRFAVYTRK